MSEFKTGDVVKFRISTGEEREGVIINHDFAFYHYKILRDGKWEYTVPHSRVIQKLPSPGIYNPQLLLLCE